MHIPPACHQDDVLSTVVRPAGPGYEYEIHIPRSQPPGLYWYHPHPHGYSEAQVLGGASGALIIEGIEFADSRVAGLPERVLILRDQVIPGLSDAQEDAGPGKDISLNFVAVMYPLFRPAEMRARPGQREFWRVLNASADTYFDLQVRTGATIQDVSQPQKPTLIAMDGVASALRPEDPRGEPSNILLAPGARAEFIVTSPQAGTFGQLVSLRYDTGPDGESTPYRVIANIRVSPDAPSTATAVPDSPVTGKDTSAASLSALTPVRERHLYFSEILADPEDLAGPVVYMITQQGATPKPFDMHSQHPDITVRQGTVEDWIIENRATEAHAFHIHQLHFRVLERNGVKIDEPMLRDTVDLPYWDGKSPKYPSVKLRMDFRNPDIRGTFLYHCHILEHEDGGMMGTIRVTSPAGK
jgi:FtsP/CotA-like multicopper oxidase with cupredoxin domain